ncbi:unnamed protein product [Moneuplotes crassus]|uniref:AtPDCT1/2 transmembrane domain-containing protein n=1 Tax=Euplotes crassus TaxID=5936 RepID=A0AAD1X354_EUPCR|nr:unnamed protein product [Moneuplotes crassus]
MQGQNRATTTGSPEAFDIENSREVMEEPPKMGKTFKTPRSEHGEVQDISHTLADEKHEKDSASVIFIQKLNSSLRNRVTQFLLMNWFKLLIAVLMLTALLIIKYGEFVQKLDVEKPYDIAHNWLLPLNLFAMDHPYFRDSWIATTSFLLDLQFFIVMINWFKDGYSMRTPVSLIMFYAIRAVIQQLYVLPFPEHIYWEDPGFPCLLNIYGRQSDFFYSGHIGFCLMCVFENYNLRATKCMAFAIFSTFFVGFTLLTFRVHYSIDIFTGIVMTHYCYIIVGKVVDKFDAACLNQHVRNMNPGEKEKAKDQSETTSFKE